MLDDERERKLESRIRGWATRDPDVRAALKRVDAVRCDYLFACCQTEIVDPARALAAARILYFIHIGGQHVVPAATLQEMEAIWTLAVRQLIDQIVITAGWVTRMTSMCDSSGTTFPPLESGVAYFDGPGGPPAPAVADAVAGTLSGGVANRGGVTAERRADRWCSVPRGPR